MFLAVRAGGIDPAECDLQGVRGVDRFNCISHLPSESNLLIGEDAMNGGYQIEMRLAADRPPRSDRAE